MADIAQPRFRIHRLDPPPDPTCDSHYRAFWRIEGQTFRVQVWSATAWERLAPRTQPDGARCLDGRGWMVLRRVDDR